MALGYMAVGERDRDDHNIVQKKKEAVRIWLGSLQPRNAITF